MNNLFDCTPPCSIACFVALYFCKISSAVERQKLKTNERENFCLRFLWSSKSFTLCFAERMDDLCQPAYFTPPPPHGFAIPLKLKRLFFSGVNKKYAH